MTKASQIADASKQIGQSKTPTFQTIFVALVTDFFFGGGGGRFMELALMYLYAGGFCLLFQVDTSEINIRKLSYLG